MPASVAPADLLARALRRDRSRPWVTYYDLGSGGRVELSVATFDNWVAKTAGLLVDGLDVEPGDVVSIVVPAHWVGLVWCQAVWTVGAQVVLSDDDRAVVNVRAGERTGVGDGALVVVSTHPLGLAGAPVPAGATDYGREVLGYPDVLALGPTPTEDPLPARLAAALAARLGTEPADGAVRRLVVAADLDERVLAEALLRALLHDGSVVLINPVSDTGSDTADERIAAIAADEQAAR